MRRKEVPKQQAQQHPGHRQRPELELCQLRRRLRGPHPRRHRGHRPQQRHRPQKRHRPQQHRLPRQQLARLQQVAQVPPVTTLAMSMEMTLAMSPEMTLVVLRLR